MKRTQILSGIQTVAENHLEWKGGLREDQELITALRLDSIRLLTLVVEIENHFQICLEEGDEEDLVRVGDLVDLLEERCK